MKRVIIHTGFPKTGTTSIQAFCQQHYDALLAEGIEFPVLDRSEMKNRLGVSHLPFLIALMKSPPPNFAMDAAVSKKLVDRMFVDFRASDTPTMLLSHESISQRQDLNFEKLKALTEGLEVEVVTFIRVYDKWLESRYAQSVRDSRTETKPFRDSGIANLGTTRQLGKLRAMKAGTGAMMRVLSYDRLKSSGVLEAFLAEIGVANPALIDAAAKHIPFNVARAPALVMFMAYAAIGAGDAVLAKTIALAAPHASGTLPFADRDFRFVPKSAIVQSRAMYIADIPALRREFGVDLDDVPPLDPASLDYETSLTRAEFDEILAHLRPRLSPADAERIAGAYEKAAPTFE